MSEIFHGFELLLLKRFQTNPELWYEWRARILSKVGENGTRVDDLEDLGVCITVFIYVLSCVLDSLDAIPHLCFPINGLTLNIKQMMTNKK